MFITFPTPPTVLFSTATSETNEDTTIKVETSSELVETTSNAVVVTTELVETTTNNVEVTTEEVEVTTQEVDTTTFNPCSGQPNGNIKDEKSCTQHFRCLMGR